MLIPDALRESVLQRTWRMHRVERVILARAAVIGRRFCVSVLAVTVPYSEATVRAALDTARGFQLIEADASHAGWHSFRHALTRDIIYEELVAARVRPLHRRVALALERAGDQRESLEDLAYHSWVARDVRRSVRYNELAGDNAVAAHAQSEARTCYSRARSLLDVDSSHYKRLTAKLLEIDAGSSAK